MSYPETERLELPILQELDATGGGDHPRYLYDRLLRYFPQLTGEDATAKNAAGRTRWHLLVQRAARQLFARGELQRQGAHWLLTERGRRRVAAEAMSVEATAVVTPTTPRRLSHKEAQQMLIAIGERLGRHAEAEFEYYDVVWRDSAAAPRLSHVFEVQISGSVDSALTRLKHAYDAQRSRLFLVIADERDTRFAGKRLSGSFHEILDHITIIGVGELQTLYEAVNRNAALLEKLLARE